MFKLVASFITFALFICAQPVFAFVPDDEELSALLKKNYGPLTSWEAEMRFPEYPGVSVNIWYARGKWRQQWKAGDTAEAVGMSGSVVASCTAGEFALSPLFVWMVPNPLETWKSWGIDCVNRNYGFCGEQPCFMLGADPGDDSMPVIHLNNEDMAPLLIRYMSEGKLISVSYSDYKTLGGYRVPQKIVFTDGGEPFEVHVTWKSVMNANSEELYTRESISATPCAEPPAPFGLLRERFRFPVTQ